MNVGMPVAVLLKDCAGVRLVVLISKALQPATLLPTRQHVLPPPRTAYEVVCMYMSSNNAYRLTGNIPLLHFCPHPHL